MVNNPSLSLPMMQQIQQLQLISQMNHQMISPILMQNNNSHYGFGVKNKINNNDSNGMMIDPNLLNHNSINYFNGIQQHQTIN
jgi:hypothetical protein